MKKWHIALIEDAEGYNDQGEIISQPRWGITDGIVTYIYPVTDYPQASDAWAAWELRMM